ncbi:MAG TPA: TfuA-like protein [Candidatus Dormibacteraeota bacterium]
MNAVIFTGPTITAGEARNVLDADYRPPAAQGDVYRAARGGPAVIAIIDGYFERTPSVWHKEILWAMSHGIHVFGGASMGALRAAELDVFGMEGVGSIFQAFRDGILEDDDEVAVAHAGPEFGYKAGSEAMVDIRFTLGLALAAGVISTETRTALESVAKSLFYPERNYALIAERAAELKVAQGEIRVFREWLPAGRASLKHSDAMAMLQVIRERLEAGVEPKTVKYTLENSSMWESAWRLAGDAAGADAVLLDSVLEELRLEGEPYIYAQRAAMLRCLAVKHSYVQGLGEAGGQVALASSRFWRARHVDDEDAKLDWLRANDLDERRLAALLDDEARAAWIQALAANEAGGYMVDQLRVSGDYPRLVERAREKRRSLEAVGMQDVNAAGVGLGREALLRWYFEERLHRPVPEDLDEYSSNHGFAGRSELEQALVREFCYLKGQPVTLGTEG